MSRVAAVQMASSPNVGANLDVAARLIARAVDDGAELIVLPENFAIMGMTEQDKVDVAEEEGKGPIQEFLSRQAGRHRVWIAGGTVPLKSSVPGKVRASCLLFNDRGDRVARYDKIHLFDVMIEASGENYTESHTIDAGDSTVVVDTPFGRLGLAVCYDLRFPELFRNMLADGAQLFAVPSAFTAITGKAHWEVLVRARAIENLAYVVAAAQGGYHINGRETFGDSMIVDPWGNVVKRVAGGADVICTDLNLEYLGRIRRNFPVINHRRLSCRRP